MGLNFYEFRGFQPNSRGSTHNMEYNVRAVLELHPAF